MRVVCDNCKAVYKIPNEKLVKAVNKATCRGCGHRMLIPRPTHAAEEATVVNNNPMTPGPAIPRAGGPITRPIAEAPPDQTLPFALKPKPGRRVAGAMSVAFGSNTSYENLPELPLLPGTPGPGPSRKAAPPRPSTPHRGAPPEEKTSWVRNPPPSRPPADLHRRDSEQPTRINPPIQKAPEEHAPSAPSAPPQPPSHNPSADLNLVVAGSLGSLLAFVTLGIDPHPENWMLEALIRSIGLFFGFGGSLLTLFILGSSARGTKPASPYLSIIASGLGAFLLMLGFIGSHTLLSLDLDKTFNAAPPPPPLIDKLINADVDEPMSKEQTPEENVAPIKPTPKPRRKTPKRAPRTSTKRAPAATPKAPKVVKVQATAPNEDLLGDDFSIDALEKAPPKPVKTEPPAVPKGVPMEVIDVMLRSNINVKKCFFSHQKAGNKMPKRVDVIFKLEGSGQVSQVNIKQGNLAGTPLDACLGRAIKGITFPPSANGNNKITFPFIFN